MSKKTGKFVLGAALGVGLGMLFAPKKGSETRKELKVKFDEVLQNVKDIDKEELRDNIVSKITEIEEQLKDLDSEKAIKIAKLKADEISKKVDELVKLAKKSAEPKLEELVDETKKATAKALKNIVKELEDDKKNTK